MKESESIHLFFLNVTNPKIFFFSDIIKKNGRWTHAISGLWRSRCIP